MGRKVMQNGRFWGKKQESGVWESEIGKRWREMSESNSPFLLQQHFKSGGREQRRLGLNMKNKQGVQRGLQPVRAPVPFTVNTEPGVAGR